MMYQLNEPKQAHTLITTLWPKIKTALESGKQLRLEIKAASKSRDQEEKYHAIIGDIAKQAQHMGAKWDVESWKRFLTWQFAKETGLNQGQIVASLDGTGIVQLGIQTRKFTKEQASEFIEWLLAWCANNGVVTQ